MSRVICRAWLLMIHYFLSFILAFLLVTSTVASNACAVETKNSCCSSLAVEQSSLGNLIEPSSNIEAISNDSSCCCKPLPNHKLPQTISKIQVNPISTVLQSVSLNKSFDFRQQKICLSVDARKPLHLASNKLYLTKRALLI